MGFSDVDARQEPEYHPTGNATADYTAAISFTRRFAEYLLSVPPTPDVDALNLNIPSSATPLMPWRFTRLSRRRYFLPTAPNRAQGKGRPGYQLITDPLGAEPDSDIRALAEGVVSVTPLSLDLTARVDWHQPASLLADPNLVLPAPLLHQCLQALNAS